MRLTIFNGSPRGKVGNTQVLINYFIEGFTGKPGNTCDVYHLIDEKDMQRCVDAFANAEAVLLGFPLYCDSMPAVVKTFIEALAPLCGRANNPAIGFIVQSGLPEAIHTIYVEQYLIKLASRLGCRYLGTVRRGGVEGIQIKPERLSLGVFKSFRNMGTDYAETGALDKGMIYALARPVRFRMTTLLFYRLMSKTGVINLYWDMILKRNKAYDQRDAKPYKND